MSVPVTLPAQWRHRPKDLRDVRSQAEYAEWLRPPPPQPDVTFYLDAHVAEFSPERTVRWAICGTGRVVAGPGSKLLHADMMSGCRALGEGETLVCGFVLWHRRAWVVALAQPIGIPGLRDGQIKVLTDRLRSWGDFVAGERVYWPEPGEGQVLLEQLDKETP